MPSFLRFLSAYGAATVLGMLLLLPTVVARANHYKGTYPNEGLIFMSAAQNYSGAVYVASNNCNSDETGAYALIQASTDNTTQMSRWANGINMVQYNCSGNWSNMVDLRILYQTNHPTAAWGENHSVLAPSSFCTYWNTSYPCGMRPTVHINRTTWNGISTANSRRRLIMHETGHSHGLNHHCNSNSIMNNGLSNCNNGRWTQVMSYQVTDRTGVNSVYP